MKRLGCLMAGAAAILAVAPVMAIEGMPKTKVSMETCLSLKS